MSRNSFQELTGKTQQLEIMTIILKEIIQTLGWWNHVEPQSCSMPILTVRLALEVLLTCNILQCMVVTGSSHVAGEKPKKMHHVPGRDLIPSRTEQNVGFCANRAPALVLSTMPPFQRRTLPHVPPQGADPASRAQFYNDSARISAMKDRKCAFGSPGLEAQHRG